MDIRPFRPEDAGEAAALIARTLREVNIRDYTEEYIESLIQRLQPQDIAARAAGTHFYGAWEGGRLIGTGGIGPLEGRAEEYGLTFSFCRNIRAGEWAGPFWRPWKGIHMAGRPAA